MKLYRLNPNTYSEHYTTAAESPEQAIAQILNHIIQVDDGYNLEAVRRWKESGYTLEEKDITGTFRAEWS